MDAPRWERVLAAFDELVDLGDAERASRLATLGAADPDLRDAVAALLRADADADAWLARIESPAGYGLRPRLHLQHRLQNALGDAYRIERELGGGGFGRVFVATEIALDRQVVVKVLPPDLAVQLNVERFRREIRFAARFQHPHIVPVLSAGAVGGLLYYTMPFVDGEGLRDRLRRERELPIVDVVRILRDVASALAYAHRHGVVHRDIKPENVLLCDGGAVVTDFGIAKAVALSRLEDAGTGAGWPANLTESGTSLGTPRYRAPEQAAGDPATDHRADLYALGVVGYEMLAGRPPFDGESAQQLMAAHATEEPEPITKRRRNVPPALGTVIMRCLEKRPADRPQHAEQMLAALDDATSAAAPTPLPVARAEAAGVPPTRRPVYRLPWVLAGLCAIVGAIAAVVLAPWPRSHAKAKVSWFSLALPDSAAPHAEVGPSAARSELGPSIALSRDGSMIAYIGSLTQSLFVRPLDELLPRRLVGSDGARCPSFSPDGQWIVFTSRGSLKKVAVRGGLPIVISDSAGMCGVWTDRNEILFDLRRQLFRVSADGGRISLVARSDSSQRIWRLIPSQALPGGNGALIQFTETPTVDWQLGFVSLPDGHLTKLTPKSSFPRVAPRYESGYVLFGHDGRIVAAPFSLRTLRFTGPEVTLLQDTITSFTTAERGSLAYIAARRPTWSLVAVSSDGQTRTIAGNGEGSPVQAEAMIPLDTAYYAYPRLSPDGRRVALEVATGPFTADVWVYDIASRTLTRLTNNFTGGRPSGWTADGRRVVFIAFDSASHDWSHRIESHRVVSQPWDGSAPPRDLMRLPVPVHDISIGPSHGYAAFNVYGRGDIWIVPLDTPKAARPLIATGAGEGQPRLSRDGRLLAYHSNETGRSEVYVRSVLGPASRLQVSAGGGAQPVWGADGRHLYYRGPEYMMRAAIARGSELGATQHDTLFRDVFARHNMTNYDVFPGGKELLMIRPNPPGPAHAAVILDWPELLRQRAAIR